MSIRDHVAELIAMVQQGQFVEAIERFYADDASMQENLNLPRKGLAALVENERKVLSVIRDMRLERVESFVVEGDRAGGGPRWPSLPRHGMVSGSRSDHCAARPDCDLDLTPPITSPQKIALLPTLFRRTANVSECPQCGANNNISNTFVLGYG